LPERFGRLVCAVVLNSIGLSLCSKDAFAMRRLIALVVGAAIGGGCVFAAFYFHVVRTDKTVLLVRKQRADWHDSYVDIRGWSSRDWHAHQELSHNLTATGRGDLVGRSMGDQLFRGLFDSFRESPGRSAGPASSK
jgi:hypothetical protein